MATARGLRTSRSSRFSSPAVVHKDPEPSRVEALGLEDGEKTFTDRWVEPAMAPSQPSYKDSKTDVQAFGVLEHMAPLGQPPSQKLLQKLKINGPRLSFRATTGTPVQNEEVLTPATEVDRMDLVSPVDTEPATETVMISSPERGRPRNQDVEHSIQNVPQENVTPSPVKLSFLPSTNTSPQSIMSPLQRGPDDIAYHLHSAIQEAEREGTRKLIPGLQKLQQDVLSDPALSAVLEAVSHGSTTRDQFRTFKKYIKSGIRQYNSGPATESMSTLRTPSVNQTTSPLQHVGAPPDTFPQSSRPTPQPQNQMASSINQPPTLKQLPSPLSHRLSPAKKVSHSPAAASNISNGRLRADVSQSRHGASPGKKRSGSVSSSSSLSSAKSIPEDFAPELEGDRANGARPVRSSGPRQGAKQKTRASSTLPPSSDHPFSHFNTVSKFASRKLKKSKDEPEYDREAIDRQRREFYDQSFYDYNQVPRDESDERTEMHSHPSSTATLSVNTVPPPVVHSHPLESSQTILSSPTASVAPAFETRLQNGTSRKRGYHEIDHDDEGMQTPRSASPTLLVPPPPIGVVGASRAVTPRAAKLPLPSKRKSARVMVSPNKPKNGGITAGVSRAGAGREAIGNAADSNEEENDEYCAACGGEGQLLCCDGCTNSFHHACLEPPLDPELEIEGEWFCPSCVAHRHKGHTTCIGPVTGLFGRIVQRVDDTIPKAFSLPYDIREYFEGVKTGDEGEYEEIGLPKTQNAVKLNRAGFVDEPDYKATRDGKGKLITCYLCGLTSHGRDIVPCDFCPARWHLDCLNPPLAMPPRRRMGDKPNATWRCPLHTEQDLTNLGRMQEAAPGDLGRIPRLRKPKSAVPIHVDLGRGFRNNGVIDIDLEPDVVNIQEESMRGKVYSIKEQDVKLDFIDRVKKHWYEDQSFPRLLNARKKIREPLYRPDLSAFPPRKLTTSTAAQSVDEQLLTFQAEAEAMANAVLRRKSFREQQAALNLASLPGGGHKGSVSGLSGSGLNDLINQLVVGAPPAVEQAVQRDEREALLELQKMLNSRLAMIEGGGLSVKGGGGQAAPTVNGNGSKAHDGDDAEQEESDVEMDLGA